MLRHTSVSKEESGCKCMILFLDRLSNSIDINQLTSKSYVSLNSSSFCYLRIKLLILSILFFESQNMAQVRIKSRFSAPLLLSGGHWVLPKPSKRFSLLFIYSIDEVCSETPTFFLNAFIFQIYNFRPLLISISFTKLLTYYFSPPSAPILKFSIINIIQLTREQIITSEGLQKRKMQSLLFNQNSSNLQKSQMNNPKILADLIINMSETKSKQQIIGELGKVDEQLYQIYETTTPFKTPPNLDSARQSSLNNSFSSIPEPYTGFLASTFYNTASVSLGVPKNNSLTDSFLRSTLGCEEKLAKSYIQIIDQTDLTEEIEKQKRIAQAKKRFAEANNYKDFYANTKPFLDKTITSSYLKKSQPVVDNEHEAYIKTQLIYLQKPLLGSKKVSEKEYYDKHADAVAKKISQIGGLEDTVANMEDSLSKNELKNFTKRAHFGNSSPNPFKKDSKSQAKKSAKDGGNSWVDRSRSIREALMTKLDIQ